MKGIGIILTVFVFSLLFGCIDFGLCSIEEEHCSYDESTETLSCGSNYLILSEGNTYWLEKCQKLSLGSHLLIGISGPFESEDEYDEFSETCGYKLEGSFKNKACQDYVNLLYLEEGTHKIDFDTSRIAVGKAVFE